MASIRKVRDKWLAEVRLKNFYKSKTFHSKIEAQSWGIETERSRGKHNHTDGGYTLSDALDRYSREVSPTKKGCRWEQIRINKLKRHSIADIKLSNLTRDDLQEWIDEQCKILKPGSVRRELVIICSALKKARVKWRWFHDDPTKDLERPNDAPHRERRISPDEKARILTAMKYHEDKEIHSSTDEVAVGFLLALETAMRQGEIWGLDWKLVFLDQRYLRLLDTKNGTPRNVPLSKRAIELLKKLEPKEQGSVFRGSKETASTLFRRAVRTAGIEDLTFHDSRHEALTYLANKVKVLDLARIVGHRDIRSLMIYYNPTATEIADLLD